MVLDRFPKGATVVHVYKLSLAFFGDRVLGIDFRQALLDISRGEPRSTIMLGANRLADQVRKFHASRAQRANPRHVARIKPNIQQLHPIIVKTSCLYVDRHAQPCDLLGSRVSYGVSA